MIAEQQLLILNGVPLSAESADIWHTTLSAAFIARNKEEAGIRFTRLSGLEFKTGKPPRDSETIVFEIELLKLNGVSYTEAYKRIGKKKVQNRKINQTHSLSVQE